jgi:hypothetical protein
MQPMPCVPFVDGMEAKNAPTLIARPVFDSFDGTPETERGVGRHPVDVVKRAGGLALQIVKQTHLVVVQSPVCWAPRVAPAALGELVPVARPRQVRPGTVCPVTAEFQ